MTEKRLDEAQPVREGRTPKVKPLVYLACAMLLLGALYVLVKPQPAIDVTRPSAARQASADAQVATPATPAPMTLPTAQVNTLDAKLDSFDIVVKRGRRVSDPAVLQVHQGDDVVLHIA